MKSTINFKYYLFFLAVLFTASSISASWEDLKSDDKKVFGSEKEAKYPINSFIIEKEEWDEHYSLMILGLYKYTDYPKYTSLRITPFYYHIASKMDDREKTVFFLPYPYYSRTENSEVLRAHLLGYSLKTPYSSEWSFLYLFYYGSNSKNNSSYNAVFPLYKYSHQDNPSAHESLFLTPFFYAAGSTHFNENGTPESTKKTFASAVFYRSVFSSDAEKIKNNELNRRIMFPVLPLVYYNYTANSADSHSAFLTFFHWYTNNDGLYRIASPVLSWKKNSYFAFWPLLSYNSDPNDSFYDFMINPLFMWENDRYLHIFPLLAFNWNSGKDHSYETMWNPLFLYDKENYFHFLPLLSFNWDGSPDHSYHAMFNPLFSWKKDRYFNLHPLLSFNYYGEDHKTVINPLFAYYRDDKLKISAFPVIPFLWYHKTEFEEKKNTYSLMTFIRFTNYDDSESGSSISPLHYYSRTDEKSIFLSPLFYSYTNYESDVKYRGFIPLYYSWKNEDNSGSLLLPVYYSNRSKDRAVNINVLGLANTYAAGPFRPVAGVDAGQFENTWYLDFTFSWLYNMFSVYYRLPLNRSADLSESSSIDENSVIKDNELSALQNTDAILSTENNSRNESLTFYGTDLFYGLFSYQKSDHMKHIRVLPLAWFTWYDNSDDRVNFIPAAYFYYKHDDLKYFLVFPGFLPVYAEQQKGNSYVKSYGIIAYWDIYNEEKQLREKDILWPVYKSVVSPEAESWRLFPVVWHKKTISAEQTKASTFSPLMYYSRDITKFDENHNVVSRTYLNVNPFLYYSLSEENSGYESFLAFPILPVYTRYRNGNVKSDRILYSLFAYERDDRSSATDLFFGMYHDSRYAFEETKKRKNWTFPLYYYSSLNGTENNSVTFTTLLNYYHRDNDGLTVNVPLIPLIHYRKTEKEKNINIAGYLYANAENEAYKSQTALFGLYYSRQYNDQESKLNWLLPFYFNYQSADEKYRIYLLNLFYSHDKADEKSYSILWPLFYHHQDDSSRTNILFPLGFHSTFNNGSFSENKFVSPIYMYSKKTSAKTQSSSLFFSVPPLLQYSYSGTDSSGNRFNNGFFLGYYYNFRNDYTRSNFLYLFDYKKEDDEKRYGLLLNNLMYKSRPEYNEFRLSYGFLMNYRNYRDSRDYDFSLLTFLYSQYNLDDNFYSSVFPVYWYKKNDQYTRRVILPLLGYNYHDQDYLYDMYGMGLVWFHYADYRNDYEKKLLLLGTLYDYTHKPLRDYTSHSQFWGLLWNYEYEGNSDYKSFSIMKFLYKRVRQNGTVKNKVLGVTVSQSTAQ